MISRRYRLPIALLVAGCGMVVGYAFAEGLPLPVTTPYSALLLAGGVLAVAGGVALAWLVLRRPSVAVDPAATVVLPIPSELRAGRPTSREVIRPAPTPGAWTLRVGEWPTVAPLPLGHRRPVNVRAVVGAPQSPPARTVAAAPGSQRSPRCCRRCARSEARTPAAPPRRGRSAVCPPPTASRSITERS